MGAKLSITEEYAFDAVIKKSITSRYDSELDRCDEYDGGVYFVPIDHAYVRDLLIELWGEQLTVNEIDRVWDSLISDGAEHYEDWPLAWCNEEDEEAAELLAREQDHQDYINYLEATQDDQAR